MFGSSLLINQQILSHNFFIYSNFNFTKNSAGCTRMLYYAKALAIDGDKVYLTTCSRSFLKDANFKEIESNIYIQQVNKGSTNFIYTLVFLFNLQSFAKQKGKHRSFIFYPSPLIFLETLALIYLKLIKRESIFYELNEIRKYSATFEDAISFKRLKYSFKKILFKFTFTIIEPLLMFYDGLICISTNIEKYGKLFNKKTIRIPILTDPDIEIQVADKQYFTEDRFNIGFSGSISPTKENLLNFLDVLGRLDKNGFLISFNLCGILTDKTFREKIEQSNLNISYFGNLEKRELSSFLSSQDLLVIPRGFTLQNKFGFSTKLSDYLNHKKLILITDISDNKLYIKDGVNGFIVPPNDNEEMYKKLVYIIKNHHELKNIILSKVQSTSLKSFSYKNYAIKLKNFLIT